MSKTWTVAYANEALQSGRWIGTFETLEAAQNYAKSEAARTRRFCTYQVCEGSPKCPGKGVGEKIRGEQ